MSWRDQGRTGSRTSRAALKVGLGASLLEFLRSGIAGGHGRLLLRLANEQHALHLRGTVELFWNKQRQDACKFSKDKAR